MAAYDPNAGVLFDDGGVAWVRIPRGRSLSDLVDSGAGAETGGSWLTGGGGFDGGDDGGGFDWAAIGKFSQGILDSVLKYKAATKGVYYPGSVPGGAISGQIRSPIASGGFSLSSPVVLLGGGALLLFAFMRSRR